MSRLDKAISAIVLTVIIVAIVAIVSGKMFGQRPEHRIVTLEDQSTVSINLPIVSEIMQQVTLEVLAKDKLLPPGEPLYLYMYSPGGEVDTGLQFISTMKALKRPIHTVNQFSASMAFIIAQYLNDRLVLPFGTLMAHPMSVEGMGGQIPGSLLSRVQALKNEAEEINNHCANRAGIDPSRFKQDLMSEIWVTGAEAVERNFADETVLVKCSKSMLEGTFVRTVSVFGAKIAVEFSKCPLLTEPISIKPVGADSQPSSLIKRKRITRDAIVSELLDSARKRKGNRVFYTE